MALPAASPPSPQARPPFSEQMRKGLPLSTLELVKEDVTPPQKLVQVSGWECCGQNWTQNQEVS